MKKHSIKFLAIAFVLAIFSLATAINAANTVDHSSKQRSSIADGHKCEIQK